MYKLDLKKSCFVPVKVKMSAVNGEGINILGAVFLRLEGTDTSTGQDPIKIHIDPEAIPKPVYTDSTVPIHWCKEVQEQLD